NPANQRLYHALMEALIRDENGMDKGVVDIIQDHKRKHDDDEDDDDEDPSANHGKALTKGSKTSKSASTKEPVEEPIVEVVMPPTPDPEWNKRQVVLDQPEQPWFNQMVIATKDPLTLNNLMATPIDFSKYVLNGLKIENLTQDILLGPAFSLLKGTCSSSIELEYNFQECFNALTEKLDWNNLEGDRYPFDLSKPLSLQGPPSHQTVVVDYFFNNDLEYLKTYDPESVSVKKLHGYGHLEEIVVKRSDQQLYKFKEGDFVDLHLNDIEDMLLLGVQHKLFHLDGSDLVDFVVALYGTLKSVRDEIHHRVLDFHLDCNKEMPTRKWTAVDRNSQNHRDLPSDIPLVSVEVHRYDIKKSKSENKGIVSTEMELVQEHAQQGTSHEVLTPPSLEWTSSSLPISPSPFVVPLPVSSPMIEELSAAKHKLMRLDTAAEKNNAAKSS
nr:hypothetical protein [Tanacetum cinerariifolium]